MQRVLTMTGVACIGDLTQSILVRDELAGRWGR
jgi:hypothetical protein